MSADNILKDAYIVDSIRTPLVVTAVLFPLCVQMT